MGPGTSIQAPNGDPRVPGPPMGECGDTSAQQQGSWIYVDIYTYLLFIFVCVVAAVFCFVVWGAVSQLQLDTFNRF